MRTSLLALCAAISLQTAFMTGNATAADKPAAPAPNVVTPVQAKDIPAMPEGSLVAKVGRGGLTKQEYDWYLLRFANRIKKTVSRLSVEERAKALEEGVDDEILFQASLADGILNDSYIRFMMGSLFRSNETTAPINPNQFTEEELNGYYESHRSQFVEAAQNHVKAAKFNSKAEAADFVRKAKQAKDPSALPAWNDIGWIGEGSPAKGLPVEISDKAAKLKKGQMSDPVMDIIVKEMHYVFLAVDRNEARQIPFDEAKGKVKFALVDQQQKENYANLLKKMGFDPKKVSEADALFLSALDKGLHRDISVRQRCINTYVDKRKAKREQLLPELKKQFPATLLDSAK